MKNRVKVIICGAEYSIMTDESAEYVKEIAYKLNETVEELMSSDPSISIVQALVLCSISYLDAGIKEKDTADNLREQVQTYLDESIRAKNKIEKIEQELIRLKSENEELTAQLLEESMPKDYKDNR